MCSGTRSLGSSTSSSGNRPISALMGRLAAHEWGGVRGEPGGSPTGSASERRGLVGETWFPPREPVDRRATRRKPKAALQRRRAKPADAHAKTGATVLRVATPVARIAASFFRSSVRNLVPYEPGKPVEEVQRELGLPRCVKLASNEGPFGPFPTALEALARCFPELNRYPDSGAWRLRNALAERLGVSFEEIAVGAGA